MVKRILQRAFLIFIFLSVLTHCAPVSTTPGQEPSKLVSNVQTAVSSLTWIKGVTDTVFSMGCDSGQFSEGLCSSYETVAGLAKASLDTTKVALANYEQSGNPLNEELLLTAFRGLSPYLLKFDTIYKNPEAAL